LKFWNQGNFIQPAPKGYLKFTEIVQVARKLSGMLNMLVVFIKKVIITD
jgi:hypothetical protein